MLGCDISRLLPARDQPMGRGHVDNAPPAFLLHAGDNRLHAEKCGGKVDRDDRVPLLLREILDVRDKLDAGIVHQDVDAAHRLFGLDPHSRDFTRLAHVRAAIANANTELFRHIPPQRLDRRRVAEAIEE